MGVAGVVKGNPQSRAAAKKQPRRVKRSHRIGHTSHGEGASERVGCFLSSELDQNPVKNRAWRDPAPIRQESAKKSSRCCHHC